MNKIVLFLKGNWKDIFKPITVLFAICVIIPLALAGTNALTDEKIAMLSEQNSKIAMEGLVEADEYTPSVLTTGEGEVEYHTAVDDGVQVAYIFKTAAKGYGGDVSVMTAISTDGAIIGVDILDVSNETPGLGQNTANESFYGQYKGKNSKITVLKNGADSSKNEIDAVTGATISSKAVTEAVNSAISYFETLRTEAK